MNIYEYQATYLSIIVYYQVDDVGMEHLSSKAPNLLALDISNCLLISDIGLTKICTVESLFVFCPFSVQVG